MLFIAYVLLAVSAYNMDEGNRRWCVKSRNSRSVLFCVL